MQFKVLSLFALLATTNAQLLSSLTAAVASGVESKISSKITGAAASYTGPGSNVVSSAIDNPSAVKSAASRVESAAGATSSAGANYNQVAQAGLGAAVVAGFWGMV